MNGAELQRIEEVLDVQLPAWYRDASLAYPFRTPGAEWMYDSPDDVIGATRYPLEDGGYQRQSWRPSLVVIGESAAGDLYLIDTCSSGSAVLSLSHEDHCLRVEWPCFEAYLAEWQDYEAEAELEQRAFDDGLRRLRRRLAWAGALLLGSLLVGSLIWAGWATGQ